MHLAIIIIITLYNYYNNAAGASVVTVKLLPLTMRAFAAVRSIRW